MNPADYEGSLEQAEYACFLDLMGVLELKEGRTATIGFSLGHPDSMTWRIAGLGTGETMTFSASAHYFRGVLDLCNRDRSTLQRWIMRLIRRFPVNHAYNRDSATREDANIVHFRIAPERGAVGEIKRMAVETTNSGPVQTWAVSIAFDVVFIADPNYEESVATNHEDGDGGMDAGGHENSTDEQGHMVNGGGFTGGGEMPDE